MLSLGIIKKLVPSLLPLLAVKSLLSATFPFATIIISSGIIGRLAQSTKASEIISYALIGVIIIFVLSVALSFVRKSVQIRSDDCYRRYEGMTGEKTLSIDYPQLENPKISDLRRRMREDRNWGAGIMSIYLVFENVLESAFTLIISIIVVFPLLSAFAGKAEAIYAVLFFVFMFALIVVYMLISRSATKKEHRIMDNTTISGRLFNFYISDGIDYKAGKDIRMYKAQKLITNKGQKIADLFAKNFFAKVSHSSGFALGIGSAISTLIQGGSYLFIALGAAAGSISIGATVRYAGSIFRFSSALSELCTSISYLSISAVRTKSAIVYFAIPDVLYHGSLTTEKRADNDYAIEFHNVSFKYPGSSIYALKNLSLNLNVGERIAVVGMNGSGKTTMIKLLYRLYDPTEGQITLNGIDIRKYNYDEYIGIFSVVFQDFRLFSFPLGQNVAASMDVNQIRARECLLKAGFGKRLDDMQKGLDTCLYREFEDDGIEISGGEAQKIALARALYKNAPFVILDEPTAALIRSRNMRFIRKSTTSSEKNRCIHFSPPVFLPVLS